jgi:hypothetical protein
MAKCEKREIPQPKPPAEYVLTLSEKEAEYLVRRLGMNLSVCDDSCGDVEIEEELKDNSNANIYYAIHNELVGRRS